MSRPVDARRRLSTGWPAGVHGPGLTGTLIVVIADNQPNPGADRRPALPSWGRPRFLRWVAAFMLLMTAVAGSAVAQPSAVRDAVAPPHIPLGLPPAAAIAYRPPLAGQLHVLRPFEPPPTPYAAGHRGVDLNAPARGWVLAAGAGRVTFAGPVAGRGVVVIAHPDGIRTEYEPVAPSVTPGHAIAQGARIGRLDGQHDRWPPGRCLHWGARRGEQYLDPLALLHPLGPVRLLPWALGAVSGRSAFSAAPRGPVPSCCLRRGERPACVLGRAAWPVRAAAFAAVRGRPAFSAAPRGPPLIGYPRARTNGTSGPGMGLAVCAQQPISGHMGVDLRRRQARVPQQLLDDAQVGTAIE
jgi:hypothetical protein